MKATKEKKTFKRKVKRDESSSSSEMESDLSYGETHSIKSKIGPISVLKSSIDKKTLL